MKRKFENSTTSTHESQRTPRWREILRSRAAKRALMATALLGGGLTASVLFGKGNAHADPLKDANNLFNSTITQLQHGNVQGAVKSVQEQAPAIVQEAVAPQQHNTPVEVTPQTDETIGTATIPETPDVTTAPRDYTDYGAIADARHFIQQAPEAVAPGISIPGIVQQTLDPYMQHQMQDMLPGYKLPSQTRYDARTSLNEQGVELLDMFSVRRTSDYDGNPSNDPNPTRGRLREAQNVISDVDSDGHVAEILYGGRYVGITNTLAAKAQALGLSYNQAYDIFGTATDVDSTSQYADVQTGSIVLSETAKSSNGQDATLAEAVETVAHEDGHIELSGPYDTAEAKRGDENTADMHAGYVVQLAIEKNYLQQHAGETAIEGLRSVSDDSDPVHGGPDERENNFREGEAMAANGHTFVIKSVYPKAKDRAKTRLQ